jgi:hypothetical protein
MKTNVRLTREWLSAADAVRQYGRARKRFRALQKELRGRVLGWNDNLVGVAGEFWACVHYRRQGYKVKPARSSTNPDYDFTARRPGNRIRVTVKSCSDEAEHGRVTRVRGNGKWDELCVVHMSRTLRPLRVGIADKQAYRHARRAGLVTSVDPRASKSVLGKKGWMHRYGTVENWQ